MTALLEHRIDALPPLHSPFDRELLARVGPWEVRRHATDDNRFAYFATRSMLHFQLWHRAFRISILTPSKLTGGRFEIASAVRRAWLADWGGVVAQLANHELPRRSELAALSLWLVVRNETSASKDRGCRRGGSRVIALARPDVARADFPALLSNACKEAAGRGPCFAAHQGRAP